MRLKSAHLEHEEGTKEYRAIKIVNADGNGVVINRWGKVGQWGQLQTNKYTSEGAADRVYYEKIDAKLKRGYRRVGGGETVEIADEEALKKALGVQYWSKVGADILKHLDPSLDTSGVRDDANKEMYQDKRGLWHEKEKPRPEPEVSVEEKIATNRNWGLF